MGTEMAYWGGREQIRGGKGQMGEGGGIDGEGRGQITGREKEDGGRREGILGKREVRWGGERSEQEFKGVDYRGGRYRRVERLKRMRTGSDGR